VTIEGVAITIEALQIPGTEPTPSPASSFSGDREKSLVNMSPALFVTRYRKVTSASSPSIIH